MVAQDTRGRWASDGEFNPFFDEARDGADTIAWAAAQPWSTGAVGMIGGSYYGATQWTAATQAPEALRAIAPFVTTDQYYDGWAYQGGAFQLGFNLHWTLIVAGVGRGDAADGGRARPGPEDFAALVAALDGNDATYRRLPLLGLPELGRARPLLRRLAAPSLLRRLLAGHRAAGVLRPDHRPGAEHGRLVRPVPRRAPWPTTPG